MSDIRRFISNFSVVVITGGSSGIGMEFIRAVSKLNEQIVFCNLSRSQVGRNFDAGRLIHFPCDLSIAETRGKTLQKLVQYLAHEAPPGKILLVNNSGVGAYGQFPEPGTNSTLSMMSLNMDAVVELTALLLPQIRERGGAIVNVASTAAFQPTPWLGAYGATKAFLLHWSLALREELRAAGIPVLALCPGPTKTNFFTRAGFSEPPPGGGITQTAGAVVQTALRALARGRGLVVSGWLNKVTVLFSGLVGKRIAARVAGRVLASLRPSPSR